jgi:hypothetical protein
MAEGYWFPAWLIVFYEVDEISLSKILKMAKDINVSIHGDFCYRVEF